MSAQEIAARIERLDLDGHAGPLSYWTQRFVFGAPLFGHWPVSIDAAASTVTVTWANSQGFSSIATTITFTRIAQQASKK